MAQDFIKHVVVLMLENRSFDQMLGDLRQVHPKLDGIDPANPKSNSDGVRQYLQAPFIADHISPDPKHELANVLNQLQNGNANFVRDYAQAYPQTSADQRQSIMNYFPLGGLPILHALAKEFLVCDQWFSSVPGPTWANRFFVHSGTSKGWVHMPEGLTDFWRRRGDFTYYDQPTIYDRLSEQRIPWCIYFNDVPQSLVLTSLRRLDYSDNFQTLDRFLIDASGEEGQFPAYAFIEPDYFWPGQNDDHPPHSTRKAQELIKTVYLAIKSNQPLWEKTLLVIVYDEHGGFYDHVVPGPAQPPDAHREEYTFDRLGVRVPAVLVSPWVDPGADSTLYDHTSILRYVSEKWGLNKLTARVDSTANIGTLIRNTGAPRPIPDMPEMKVVYGLQEQADEVVAAEPLNANQAALYALTEFLEMERAAQSKTLVDARVMAAIPLVGIKAVAHKRVAAFLKGR